MQVIKKAKKSLGQNFLIDKNIINKIIEIGKINKNKNILEIGPGYGSLTNVIINKKPAVLLRVFCFISNLLPFRFEDFLQLIFINLIA